jgi:hypothetical protein
MTPALLALVAAVAAASPQATPSSKAKNEANKPVTMNGCVAREASGAKEFTFTESSSGFRYRLSGQDVSKFVDQPLEIVGIVDTTRLRVKGGLYPTPNVAAQAGAMDPGKAHVATLGGGTTGSGTPELPTFKVAQVKAAQGECRK